MGNRPQHIVTEGTGGGNYLILTLRPRSVTHNIYRRAVGG